MHGLTETQETRGHRIQSRWTQGSLTNTYTHTHIHTHTHTHTGNTHSHLPIGAPRRELSHADIGESEPKPKLELRSAGEQDGVGGDGGQNCDQDVDWQSEIVYTGEVLGVGSFSVVHAARNITSGTNARVCVFCVFLFLWCGGGC